MEDLSRILREHPFLEGLSPESIATLTGCASNRKFEVGEYLCREGEQADVFYLLRAGKVALEIHIPQHGGLRLKTFEEGDVIGWSWLLFPYTWHFDVRVVHPARALVLDARCLREKCEHDHDLGYEMLKRFSALMMRTLEATRLQLVDAICSRPEVTLGVGHH